MADEKLRVVVVGAGGVGARIGDAVRQSERLELVGLSDRDGDVAQEAGTRLGVAWYTDNRSLLAETRPGAALLCVPPMTAPELVAACADRGIHVWMELPLARNVAEGAAMVRRMEEAGLLLAVGTQRRFAAGYRRAYELRHRLGDVFLARAHYLFNWGADLRWRADRESAGGGALLELGYHPIDLVLWTLGVPETVYGVTAVASPGGGRRSADTDRPPYDTDDTAAAVFRYRSGLTATVVTTRCSGPVSEELSLHGREGSITATAEVCLLRDPDGRVLDHVQDTASSLAACRRQLDAFATAVLEKAPRYACSGWENLLNLAVIDALYLSHRTAQPENVLGLLRPQGLTLNECLAKRPLDPEGEGKALGNRE